MPPVIPARCTGCTGDRERAGCPERPGGDPRTRDFNLERISTCAGMTRFFQFFTQLASLRFLSSGFAATLQEISHAMSGRVKARQPGATHTGPGNAGLWTHSAHRKARSRYPGGGLDGDQVIEPPDLAQQASRYRIIFVKIFLRIGKNPVFPGQRSARLEDVLHAWQEDPL